MKNQYLLYTISCKVSKSIFNFTRKAFSKNCQCILLAKEFKLSKVTKLKRTNWGKRGQGCFWFMKLLKGLVRTMVLNGACLDFKELQSSWSPLLSQFSNCHWLGPSDLLQEGPEALCWQSLLSHTTALLQRETQQSLMWNSISDKCLLLASQLSLSSIIFWVLDLCYLRGHFILHRSFELWPFLAVSF